MAGDTYVTVVGNLTADPEVRTTSNGNMVADFTIASTSRQFNRNSGQWEDGSSLFMRCSAWNSNFNSLASNVQASLAKGMRVIAQGRLFQRSFQDREGNSRTVVEMRVDEIGPALSRNTAQVMRNPSAGSPNGGSRGGFAGSGNGGYQGGYQGGSSYQGGAGTATSSPSNSPQQAQQGPAQDPWSSTSSNDSFGSFGSTGEFGGSDDEPEF